VSDLCAVADIPDGGGIRVVREGLAPDDGSEPANVIVVRDGDEVYAYANVCPHFGIPLDVGRGIKTFRKHVLCVNHYAAFRFSDGACVEGPCLGASLRPVPIDVRGGRVTSRGAAD
jgi:nitrite reductase/ring-hydroxylating ferredoxin subunit